MARPQPRTPRKTIPPTARRLPDPEILLGSSVGVRSRARRARRALGVDSRQATTARLELGARVGQLLREGRALPEHGSLPVDDIDGDNEDEGDAEEDCGGVGEVVGVVLSADI